MALRTVLDTRFFFSLYDPSSRKQEEWCRSVVHESKRSSPGTFLASCITVAELYENMGRLMERDAVSLRISSIKNSGVGFIPVDEEIASHAGDLKLYSGELPMSDAIIAATALLHTGGRLFSDDEHLKKIKSLKLSWVD